MNMGKVGSPQERESVNSLLNSLMYIVLGDDTVFQRARQHTQKSRYHEEESETEFLLLKKKWICVIAIANVMAIFVRHVD